MAADASAYAALGLEPGADSASIERAYKKLIKQYHPDRDGGDPRRAAEINRAYRELRRGGAKEALVLDDGDQLRGGPNWVRAALLLTVALGALLAAGPAMRLVGNPPVASSAIVHAGHVAPTARAVEPMDQPLELAAIDGGLRDAVRISRSGDEVALANASRDCHRHLRASPSIARLDRCAAFDDAVVELQDRDPLRDRGPFSELAVTGRLMGGGTLFSGDYLAIDGRLDRIRLRVELALAVPEEPAEAPAPAAGEVD